MKKIKEKDGKSWCKWCPEKTVKAVWGSSGMVLTKHACEEHKEDLQEHENKYRDDGSMSEGDYQSWGRI